MRLHTNVITPQQILDALTNEIRAGRIAQTVRFKERTQHGSHSRAQAYEIQLESTGQIKGDGRRLGNSGSYGAMDGSNGYAATYDEWGWLMSALYDIDPDAVWGTVKHPQYASRADFDRKTGLTYNYAKLLPALEAHFDPYPWQGGRSVVGRRGAGRVAGANVPESLRGTWFKFDHRKADDYRKFAHLTEAATVAV